MKQIVITLICSLCLLHFKAKGQASQITTTGETSLIQARALKVLQDQCNACHEEKNPSKYFELENMNGFAKKIQRQVFLWKRMPKGKEYTLSDFQKETLKTWINNQLNNK